jgi:hypothetical protein
MAKKHEAYGPAQSTIFWPNTSTGPARCYRAWAGTSTTLGCVGLQTQPIVPAQHDTKILGTTRPMCRHEAQ